MTAPLPDKDQLSIAVVGLGYVGLPLAVAFGERRPTLGFDIDARRVEQLRRGVDPTREVTAEALAGARQLRFSADPAALAECNVYIVAVPTPVDAYKRPDLGYLEAASAAIGRVLQPGDVVIYEATVYPGATEEVCVPILERESGLHWRTGQGDFHVGYSPERINPGDGAHSLRKVVKVTAASSPEALAFVDALYREIVEAGTHPVHSIRVAEAAKVIENTQRDLNIALVNELALIFNRLGLDTHEVLEAAGTKWNFLPFRPGLVGGHCIGVDPYYLTHKAEAIGYHPEVILAGRRINDGMGRYIAQQVIKRMTLKGVPVLGARVLILGLAFKEDCADIRNTRVIDIVREFEEFRARVDVHDPWVDPEDARREYAIELTPELRNGRYDAVILAVAHREYRELGAGAIRALGRADAVLYDVKSVLPPETVDGRL
ncbi:MAG: nucleotide sugar dehydrogenase [Candidatus Competibacterales bacterium]|nr:nucleotide sugar dehydrogenase [Candidatus Competibacterales bacterium]